MKYNDISSNNHATTAHRYKRRNRLFTFLLSILMIINMMPSMAWAEDGNDASDGGALDTYSSCLNNFLDSGEFTLNGFVQNISGGVTLTAGDEYQIDLHFAEQINGSQIEFPCKYKCPDGLESVKLDKTDGFIDVEDQDKTYSVKIQYEIDNGEITVSIPETGQVPGAVEALADCANCKFDIHLSGSVSNNTTKIKWSESLESNVTIQEPKHVLAIEKNGFYNKDTNKIEYTIKVQSTGTNNNVVVKDTVTGTALRYNDDAKVYSDEDSQNVVQNATVATNGNGFTCTIPSMNNQTYYIKYSAAVDLSKITGEGTSGQTSNKVSVKSNENPQDQETTKDLPGAVKTTDVSKVAGSVSAPDKNGKVLVPWTITLNENALISAAGAKVTDSIDASNRSYTKYAGKGITITKYNKVGWQVSKETMPWSDLPKYDNSSWEYTIPESDTTPYKYVITYNTEVDTTGKLVPDVKVVNHSNYNKNGDHAADATVTVHPDENRTIGIKKEVLSANWDTIDWKVTLNVPAQGLDTAEAFDTMPSKYFNGKNLVDNEDVSTLKVSGLYEGETYTGPTISDDGTKYTIVFHKDGQNGLKPSKNGKSREIVITFRTINNEEWKQQLENSHNQYDFQHTNNASFVGNGQQVDAQATATVAHHSIQKNGESIGDINGLPAYFFLVTVTGHDVNQDLDITDTFDTSIFEYVDTDVYCNSGACQGHQAGRVCAVDSFWHEKVTDAGKLHVAMTQTGATIHVNSQDLPKKDNGTGYKTYKAAYVLKVKNQDALHKLQTQAIQAGGTAELVNTAEVNGIGQAQATVTYKYPLAKKTVEIYTNGERPYAEYRVVLNPDAADLVVGDHYEVEDNFSANQVLDYDSVNFYPSVDTSFDVKGHKILFTVPDSKMVTITYRMWITGTGTFKIENTLSMMDFPSEGVMADVIVNGPGSGTASNYGVKLLKYRQGDMSKRLEGAKFSFWQITADGEWEPVVDKNNQAVTFTTDSNGEILVYGSEDADGWVIIPTKSYELREEKAPEGYKVDSRPIRFTMYTNETDIPANEEDTGTSLGADSSRTYVIGPNEVIPVSNMPLPDKVSFDPQIHKNVTGDVGAASRQEFTFRLTSLDGAPLPENDVNVVIAKRNETKHFGNITYKEEGTYNYAITEEKPNPVPEGWTYSTNPVNLTVTVTKNAEGKLVASGVYDNDEDLTYGTITNEFHIPTTSITVDKKWIGKALNEATINLYADGQLKETATITGDDQWKHTFNDLPKCDNTGEAIEYTVSEKSISGYEGHVRKNEDGSYTFTNTDVETLNIPVSKKWIGDPIEQVTIELRADGNVIKTETLSEANNWKSTFKDLQKYDVAVGDEDPEGHDGHLIQYTITEPQLDGYHTRITGNTDIGFVVTNKSTATTELTVTKDWLGPVGGPVQVDLMQKAEPIDEKASGSTMETIYQTVTLNTSNKWKHKFTSLPLYSNDGKKFSYTVKEHPVQGYESSTETRLDGRDVVITNKNTEKTSVKVTKNWVGGQSVESVHVTLFADGKATSKTVDLTKTDNWQYTFTDLPKYNTDRNDGHKIVYTVQERRVDGFEPNYTENVDNEFVITNTFQKKKNIRVTKKWIGPAPEDGSITVRLHATISHGGNYDDHTEEEALKQELNAKTVILTQDSDWKGNFNDLPIYDDAGHAIDYTVEEDVVPDGYSSKLTTNANGDFIITNINTEKLDIQVSKEWVGKKLGSVTAVLKVDGRTYSTIDLKESNNWRGTFTNLPKYSSKDGHKITYTLDEDELEGYNTTIQGDAQQGFVIKNTSTEKISIPVEKKWLGAGTEEVTVQLLADGKKIGEDGKFVTLKKANNWKGFFDNLPKYEEAKAGQAEESSTYGGHKIHYTVSEEPIKGYDSNITGSADDGYTITNANTARVSISVTKIWLGAPADEATMNLLADGEKVDSITLNQDCHWQHTFEELPKYDLKDGHEIKYTIDEIKVAGYISKISGSVEDGFKITNTRIPLTGIDKDKPSDEIATGDTSNLTLCIVLLLVSVAAMIAVAVVYKRSNKNK